MTFAEEAFIFEKRPGGLDRFSLPRREDYYPSPVDWREEVLYFLLVDRFSDGKERKDNRRLLDRHKLSDARKNYEKPWSRELWADSGKNYWQGGTLQGVISQLDYIKNLGITTIWLSPVFKQRGEDDTYHGYGIQDFLDVDPHFGTRMDLVKLIASAHEKKLRVLLDIIFNHSGCNWLYPEDARVEIWSLSMPQAGINSAPGEEMRPIFLRE